MENTKATKLLTAVASADLSTVIFACLSILDALDEAESTGSYMQADFWREMSRAADSVAALRFDNWAEHSPAQRADACGA